jgi:hypothetical protein
MIRMFSTIFAIFGLKIWLQRKIVKHLLDPFQQGNGKIKILSVTIIIIITIFIVVLEIEHSTSHMLGKCSTT